MLQILMILALIHFSCSCVKGKKMVKIVSEEFLNGNLIRSEYTLSYEDAELLMKALDREKVDYSADVLKIEFEKSYTIIIDNNISFSLNRNVEDETNKIYMFDLRTTPVLGTYVSADIVKYIDDIISK